MNLQHPLEVALYSLASSEILFGLCTILRFFLTVDSLKLRLVSYNLFYLYKFTCRQSDM